MENNDLPTTVEFWREKLDNIRNGGKVRFLTSDVADGERMMGKHRLKPNWDQTCNDGNGHYFVQFAGFTFVAEQDETETDYSAYPPWMIDITEGTIEFPTLLDDCGCPVKLTLEEWAVL